MHRFFVKESQFYVLGEWESTFIYKGAVWNTDHQHSKRNKNHSEIKRNVSTQLNPNAKKYHCAHKPDKFKNPRRQQAAAVEGAGGSTYRSGGVKGYADLPPEAKAACDKFVNQKLITQKQYLAEYEWEE